MELLPSLPAFHHSNNLHKSLPLLQLIYCHISTKHKLSLPAELLQAGLEPTFTVSSCQSPQYRYLLHCYCPILHLRSTLIPMNPRISCKYHHHRIFLHSSPHYLQIKSPFFCLFLHNYSHLLLICTLSLYS